MTVGIISTDVDAANPNFQRPDGSPAVVHQLIYASGGAAATGAVAEGFGDVSSIASQGTVTYDLADVINPQAVTLPGGHCWIRVVGVAPGADVITANVLDQSLSVGGVVQAIDAMVAADVDVISESFGWWALPDSSLRRAVQAANDAAIDAGVTVVVASGDSSGDNSIGNPAADPAVIAVGAGVTGRLAAQIGWNGITRFGNGSWTSATTAGLSSAGITVGGRTIDVVAPGDAGWSSCTASPRYDDCVAVGDQSTPADVIPFSGTSQAAPLTAGVAALVIQSYRAAHLGADPTPQQVRSILAGTATDLGLPADQQGAGLVDAFTAVRRAQQAAGPDGATLVAADTQLLATGTGPVGVSTTVTNVGPDPVLLDDIRLDTETVSEQLTYPVDFPADAPAFVDGLGGATFVAASQSVHIPPGVQSAHLQVGVTPDDPNTPAGVELTAVGPDGTVHAWTDGANGADVWLPAPMAGRWTVVVQQRTTGPFRAALGVDLTRRRTMAAGTADAAVLPPGASTRVSVTAPLPEEAGDTAAMLRVGDDLRIPVVLRRMPDLSTGAATVTDTAVPANARPGSPSQQLVQTFDVTDGRRSLSVDTVLGAPAVAGLTSVLIDPTGMARSIASNGGPSNDPPAGSVQQTVADPAPGRWQLVVAVLDPEFTTPAAGAPLTTTVALDAVKASADGLPDGEALVAGSTRTVQLSVGNPGAAPLAVLLDPRTSGTATVPLPPLRNPATVALPIDTIFELPMFLVPPFSTAVTFAAQSSVPMLLEAAGPGGSPDLVTDAGTAPSIRVNGAEAAQGPWEVFLAVPGPVPAGGSPPGTATLTASAETAPFDASVTGPGGADLPAAAQIVAPGATGSITAELHVPETVGQQVTGFLALTTPPYAGRPTSGMVWPMATGDVLAVFPYRYTVMAAEPVGPVGPVGPPGPAGPLGPVGPPGPTGPVGPVARVDAEPPASDSGSAVGSGASDFPHAGRAAGGAFDDRPSSDGSAWAPTGRASTGRASTGSLPRTGAAVLAPAVLGGALLLAGALVLMLTRRRRLR